MRTCIFGARMGVGESRICIFGARMGVGESRTCIFGARMGVGESRICIFGARMGVGASPDRSFFRAGPVVTGDREGFLDGRHVGGVET